MRCKWIDCIYSRQRIRSFWWRIGIVCNGVLLLLLCGTKEAWALRLISLSPALTETVAALGACSALVATVAGGVVGENSLNFCKGVPQLPLSGGHWSAESLLALRPQAVLVWPEGLSGDQLMLMRSAKLPLVLFSVHQMQDVQQQLLRLGALTGKNAQARLLLQRQQVQISTLTQKYQGSAWIRGFYQVWSQPLMTLTTGHYVAEALRLCHIALVAPVAAVQAPQVAVEWVLMQHPDRIILPEGMTALEAWSRWGLPVRQVDVAALERPGPFMLDHLEQVCAEVRRQEVRRH